MTPLVENRIACCTEYNWHRESLTQSINWLVSSPLRVRKSWCPWELPPVKNKLCSFYSLFSHFSVSLCVICYESLYRKTKKKPKIKLKLNIKKKHETRNIYLSLYFLFSFLFLFLYRHLGQSDTLNILKYLNQ